MGDQWEEQRLEERERFLAAHRLKLSQESSDRILNLIAAFNSLSDELLHQAKTFKAALGVLAGTEGIQTSDTLRIAYSKLAATNMVSTNNLTSGNQVISAEIIEARKVMDSLGSAVSSMMGINRCIPSLNKVKKLQRQVELSIHTEAALAMKNASGEFIGQTIQVELASGELIEVRPHETSVNLEGLSMDSTIQDLMAWRAVGSAL
jgi:hypothetical protein